ncbi:hypothetical protein LTR56_010530 [Elasticomyces elasticus]|nr:hypothetical protein LTR56_010530 [Elasticomyces elasticus]KAK3657946.1 hypothetical protein LTR22_009173 [Elasticomyces elasticus]KAK5762853.1 hypothetical protein LTS12_007042 [Elasticomyces elasticus]
MDIEKLTPTFDPETKSEPNDPSPPTARETAMLQHLTFYQTSLSFLLATTTALALKLWTGSWPMSPDSNCIVVWLILHSISRELVIGDKPGLRYDDDAFFSLPSNAFRARRQPRKDYDEADW